MRISSIFVKNKMETEADTFFVFKERRCFVKLKRKMKKWWRIYHQLRLHKDLKITCSNMSNKMSSTLSCFCITNDNQIACITAAHTILPLIKNKDEQLQIHVQSFRTKHCLDSLSMKFTHDVDTVLVPINCGIIPIVRPEELVDFTYSGVVDSTALQAGQEVYFFGMKTGFSKCHIFLPQCKILYFQKSSQTPSIIEGILTCDLYTRKGDSGGALFMVNESTKTFSFIGILRGKLLGSLDHCQLSPNQDALSSMPYCDSIRIFTSAALIQSQFSISHFLL